MSANPPFSEAFIALFNDIGLQVDNRLGDFETRLRALLMSIEAGNTQQLQQQQPNLSERAIQDWITRLSFEIDTNYGGDIETFVQEANTVVSELKYVDLLIVDNDVLLDDDGLPVLTDSRASIAQDIQHMIREKGWLIEIIGQRDKEKREASLNKIILEVDEDYRIIAGTCTMTESDTETYWLVADTLEFGEIGFWL